MSLNIKKFGKFKLLKQIARGGMAEIFLACTGSIKSAHKFVVIKRVSLMHSHSQEFNKMFQNEGKIAINLNHSNIGSIYEFGVEEGDQYFICMEYISGRNIRQLVKKLKSQKKNLRVEYCAHIIKYVCNGLNYAHNCTDNVTGQPLNIIHRDISPQNIMVSFGGDIKVIDFGIAKIDDSEATKAGVLKGKFEYMSPEQARGKGGIDKQTDIFSLGNVLWELLAGRKLFIGADEIQLLRKIRECQVPDLRKINPQVPDPLSDIVNKALNANKNLRYKTVAQMGHDISIFLNKHYPTFTDSHFNSFIKEVYIEEIMEERQNLKTFSQALKKPLNKHGSLKDLDTITETHASQFKGYSEELDKEETESDNTKSYLDENTVSIIDKDFEEKQSGYTETETKSNMTGQKTALTKTEFDDSLDSNATASPLTESYTISHEGSNRNTITTTLAENKKSKPKNQYTPWYSPMKRDPLTDRRKILKRQKKKTRVFQRVFMGLFILSALSASYFFSSEIKSYGLKLTQKLKEGANKHTQMVSEREGEVEKTEEQTAGPVARTPTSLPNPNPVKKDSSPPVVQKNTVAIRKVFLTTRPSGAQVYVNGVQADNSTPTSISLHPNQRIQLLIKKEGYRDKKINLSPQEIKLKMQYSLIKKAGGPSNETIVIRKSR